MIKLDNEIVSCSNKKEMTSGQILFSNNQYVGQVSCIPDISNIGNYYTKITVRVFLDYNDSICSRGWMLPKETELPNLHNSINFIYNINQQTTNSISAIPLSFIKAGYYYVDGSFKGRLSQGGYIFYTQGINIYSVANLKYYDLGSHYNGWHFDTNGNGYSLRCDATDT